MSLKEKLMAEETKSCINSSDISQFPVRIESESKDETFIKMDTTTNFSFVTSPSGPFTDKKIRNDFIQKVYSILTVQIVFTAIGASVMFYVFYDNLNYKTLNEKNDGSGKMIVMAILIIASIITFCIIIAFCCSVTARRAVPINYILLGVFTIAETLIVGVICAQTEGENIIIAFCITGVVVLSITLLATTPYFDITHCGCVLCILAVIHFVMAMIILGVVMATDIDTKPLYLILAVFGSFLFSLYLLYDTQLILGGKKYEISTEEYIFAAICLYIDIIQIFLHILMILMNIRD